MSVAAAGDTRAGAWWEGEGTRAGARLRVLASGSSGNCSVIETRGGGAVLVDLGLSPRRTRRELAEAGVSASRVTDVLLTHLDSDHFHAGWLGGVSEGLGCVGRGVRVWVHERHERTLRRSNWGRGMLRATGDGFETDGGVRARVALAAHDHAGVATYRLEFAECGGRGGGTLGFATDVGRATDEVVEHLRGVDVLAIESNYCPEMQRASSRPYFLKRRIMGGAGHLSNEECASAVAAIGPRRHVVLLHLSRECNEMERATRLHVGGGYAVTCTSQYAATAWIGIEGDVEAGMAVRERARLRTREEQLPLFGGGHR